MSSDVKLVEPLTSEDGETTSVITHGRWRKRKTSPSHARGGPHDIDAEETQKRVQLQPGMLAPLAVDRSKTTSKGYIKQMRKRYPATEAYNERLKAAQQAEMTAIALQGWRSTHPEDTEAPNSEGSSVSSNEDRGRRIVTLTMSMPSDPAWREQLYPMFLRIHLPAEVFQGCKDGPRRMQRNWLMNLRDTAFDESPALETAMTALSMARVGRKDRHQGLINHSLDLYTESLHHLQKALHDPKLQKSDQTLAACLTLAMYEVTECPSRKQDGYNLHQSGGLALLQKRGPEAHATVLGHSLFVFLRIQHFLYSLGTRKSSFFSEPAWLNMPWQCRAKDPHDMFMEQMYCIPVLMEKTDTLEQSRPERDALLFGYREIISQYQAVYNCLQGWYRDLRAMVAGPLYDPELATIKCPEFEQAGKPQPFPVAFHFPAFSVGQSMIVYWCVVMVTTTQMAEVQRKAAKIEGALQTEARGSPLLPMPSSVSASTSAPLVSPSPSTTLAAAIKSAAISRSMAKNICQSIEFFFGDFMGDLGVVSMLLPLIAVKETLNRAQTQVNETGSTTSLEQLNELSDTIIWINHMIKLVGQKGYLMALYLDNK